MPKLTIATLKAQQEAEETEKVEAERRAEAERKKVAAKQKEKPAGVRPPASKVRAGRQNRRSDRGVHKAIKAEGVDADGL